MPAYYLNFSLAFLTLQFLIYFFSRTITWLCQDKLSKKAQLRIKILLYVVANGVVILALMRITDSLFCVVAFILVFLLFSMFVRVAIWGTALILKFFVNPQKLNKVQRFAYPIGLIGLLFFTLYNAYTPVVKHYAINIDKPLAPLRIGVASDLHLGKFFGSQSLDKLAKIMNDEKVDIILLPGDIMDDNLDAFLAENMSAHLTKLKAPLGVYITLGNHDFFNQPKAIYQELIDEGFHVLWDDVVTVDNKFTIIGRNDELDHERMKSSVLLQGVNPNLPIILMDHRPTSILQHSMLSIDIQFSGHTHRGQIFPANLITKFVYTLDYGYKKINNGHFFVTSGFGFWGVPMRLGTQSEVFIIDVVGK